MPRWSHCVQQTEIGFNTVLRNLIRERVGVAEVRPFVHYIILSTPQKQTILFGKHLIATHNLPKFAISPGWRPGAFCVLFTEIRPSWPSVEKSFDFAQGKGCYIAIIINIIYWHPIQSVSSALPGICSRLAVTLYRISCYGKYMD